MKYTQENQFVEFKRELTNSLEKEVVAFLNSEKGGEIFLGIDNNAKIFGIENTDQAQLEIVDRIKSNIAPNCLGLFDISVLQEQGKKIIRILVARGLEKPYHLKKYGLAPKGCFLRVGAGVQPMEQALIDKLYATRTRDSLAKITSPRNAEHNFGQLKIYYEEKGFPITDKFLENLDLYTEENKLNYVAYLLADTNSNSMKVAKYKGKDKQDLIEVNEYGYCSLLKATHRILDKLEVENATLTKITGKAQREQKRLIEPIALREAFINAVVHNDYTSEVSPVVEIYQDRLTITSYGGLVQGLSKEEFFAGRSMPRNRELMRIFRDMELVEQLGSGMHRILANYDNANFKITENFLELCFLFDEQVNAQATMQVTMQATMQATMQVNRLLKVLENDRVDRDELQKRLKLKNRDNFRKNYLKPALELGLIAMTQPNSPNSPTQKYYRIEPQKTRKIRKDKEKRKER